MDNQLFEDEKEEERYCEKCGKICYSLRMAGQILNSQKKHKIKNRRISKNARPCRKYYCDFCNSYHLTSTPFYREYAKEIKNKKGVYNDYE